MAAPVDAGLNGDTLLDTCGTGGDGCDTFNISTVAAFVVAGAGVHVAKHGNRSISSQCGSADLLEAWGIRIALPPDETARAIREVGIGFLFAPAMHTAMKHAQPVRVDLKMRTVFNLLGPLTNPAGATAQLIGAPSAQAAELMAGALAALGTAARLRGARLGRAGRDHDHGSDVWPGKSATARWKRGHLEPADFAVQTATPEDLRGGDRRRNLEIANAVLAGARGSAARYRAGECRRGAGGGGQGGDLPGRHGARRGVDRFGRGQGEGGGAGGVWGLGAGSTLRPTDWRAQATRVYDRGSQLYISGIYSNVAECRDPLDACTGFEWDEANAHKNWERQQVTPEEAEDVFFNEPLVVRSDARHSQAGEKATMRSGRPASGDTCLWFSRFRLLAGCV